MNVYDNSILTPVQYGSILVPGVEVGKARGSGNFNPLPYAVQSTDRGNAWQDAYPLYVDQVNSQNNSKNFFKGMMMPEPIDMDNIGAADFNTPSDFGDTLRKRIYQVGSTGLHAEDPGSWNRPEYKGADNQYVEWALKALVPGGITPTPLITYFFHKDNVNYIQERLIAEIKKINGTTISPQSVDEILIIMRNKIIYAYSGWLPHSGDKNGVYNRGEDSCTLQTRLTRLNKSVIEELVSQTLSGINMYKKFINDQASMPVPLSLPVYTSMSGSRELSPSIGFNSGHERTLAANSFNMRYNIL